MGAALPSRGTQWAFPSGNKSFLPAGFAVYVAALSLPDTARWAQFITLHNTAPPTLRERPNGFSPQNMADMADFYAGKGWHAGPHLFIDDTYIHVFSDLRHTGVHTPSWNHCSWGIEQLGDYDTDDYNAGRGALVKNNAVAAIAILSHFRGLDTHSLRLHKEDPATTHRDCPGSSCADRKAEIMQAAHDYVTDHFKQG